MILILLLCALFHSGLEASRSAFVYTIPGINGLGSEANYVRTLLGDDSIAVVPVETPRTLPDLGQSRCINYLDAALTKDVLKIPVIIHATSQGTATALNYFAEVDKGKSIGALILEAPLVTGNSAVCHTLKGPLMNRPGLVSTPFSYYWLPYCAKTFFPFYWPFGKQVIKSIKSIPDECDVPIIIVHSKDDPQLPYDDACALYYGLCLKNKNVYLISKDGRKHLNILQNEVDKKVVRAILAKHNLITEIREEVDLECYQPDAAPFKEKYEELVSKERKHVFLGYGLMAACCALLIKPACSLYNKIHNTSS